MTESWKIEAHHFLHDCDRSERYHRARRAFLDFWYRMMMVFVLISGSSSHRRS